ncbi:hypothetical protein [Streptomyces shenzhenensis]|uniref:hypothetical protein n=1 Tax=Streptomyces shenzhenensis TaxID=943815 RepID=UPI001F1F37FE|nr:hypothetical protein [Streptomyces shenzhenensis]
MPVYRAVEVAPDGGLRLTGRELVQPAAGHVRILTGTPAGNGHHLRFAEAHDIAPLTEQEELADAAHAYDRMLRGAARFRMVLTPC